MDDKSIMAADETDSTLANGGLTMENGVDSVKTVDTTSESPDEKPILDAIEHPKEVAEVVPQVETVDDQKCMKGQKAQRKLTHEKLSCGKNSSSVRIKKNKERKNADAKVAASNGSVAPNVHTTKSLKSKSFNGRETQVTKQGKHNSALAESTAGDKVKPKPQQKQAHETSEDDTQSSNSPKADDGKPRKVGALPKYGFSFKCDQRAEKRKEFYVKLEEKTHAKEEEINNIQAKSKETQVAELRMLRKSLNFKATPMPSFYQEPQPPKTELKKIPPTRPKSPKLGRKKTASGVDCEETQNPSLSRLSLDEKASKDNPTIDLKKQPARKSLPRLPSQKTALPASRKATTKVKPESEKLETLNQLSNPIEEEAQMTILSKTDAENSDKIVSPKMNEDRTEFTEVSEAVSVVL